MGRTTRLFAGGSAGRMYERRIDMLEGGMDGTTKKQDREDSL